MDKLGELVSFSSTGYIAIIVILGVGIICYMVYVCFNDGPVENYPYNLAKRRFEDRTIINGIRFTIAITALITMIVCFTVGISSMTFKVKKDCIASIDEFSEATQNSIDEAFGGKEKRKEIVRDIRKMGISEFEMSKEGAERLQIEVNDCMYSLVCLQ